MQRRPTKKALASEQVDLFAIYGSFNPQTTHPVHATSQKEIFSFFWISYIAGMSPMFCIPSEKRGAKSVVGLSFRIAVLPTACQLPVNFLCWTHRNLSRGRNCRQPDGGKIPTSCVVPANSGGERGKVICGRIYPGAVDDGVRLVVLRPAAWENNRKLPALHTHRDNGRCDTRKHDFFSGSLG